MPIVINKLADLKRALALPGLMVRMTQCDAGTERVYNPEALVTARAGRRIYAVRSNDFIFEGRMPRSAGAYLYYGKASDWEFNGTHVVTCRDKDVSGMFLTYALTIEPEVITGAGQFKAGHGAIVTDWFDTEAEAVAAFVHEVNR